MAHDNRQSQTTETSATTTSKGSYISALKLMSSKSKMDAKRNRMIERLRECTDMELASIGLNRDDIERSVYGSKLA